VSYNSISVLYAKTCDLLNLEVLILNNNNLKKLPEQIDKLRKIETLSIAANQLETLPEMIISLRQLKNLDISKNKFVQFPVELFSINTLEKLWLGKNVFNEFPSKDIVEQLPSLKYLYCFSSSSDSINSVHNDYAVLQQKKGNCLEALKLICRQDVPSSPIKIKLNKPHVFISYSHKDKAYKDEVEVCLKGIKYLKYDFTFWSDTDIELGEVWKQKIIDELSKSGIVINIISRDYLASDFIQKIELPLLLKRAKQDGTLILNLLARRCVFPESLSQFQAVNYDSPIEGESKDGQDSIYLVLTQRIIKEITNMKE